MPLLFAKVVVAGGNSSVLCRVSLWEQLSGSGDFVAQNDTSADVGLCGVLGGRWFLLVLVNKALSGLAVCWAKNCERNLFWLGR